MSRSSPVSVFAGPAAFSDFRLRRLLQRLRAVAPATRGLSADHLYLVSSLNPADSGEAGRLGELLSARPLAAGPLGQGPGFLVTPRPGTVSPWSSKATDIARNCGLSGVLRIERATRFLLDYDGPLSDDALAALAAPCHDRMTEAILPLDYELERLFADPPAAPERPVPFMTQGRDALIQANRDLGLALSDTEIDYLARFYDEARRDPSDVELMMFAQANSEHCRHKIFNARFSVDGVALPDSLFGLIRATHRAHPDGTIVAYADNAAVIVGPESDRFYPGAGEDATPPPGRSPTDTGESAVDRSAGHVWRRRREAAHIVFKVETHNHPTAVCPFPGAATGAGGEIRDEGATGRGARPKAGLCGFCVSRLDLPEVDGARAPVDWPITFPARLATPVQIMIDGPIGAAAFNNEFGRPNLCGYFRSFEIVVGQCHFGYHKPIMLAGGVGVIRPGQTEKLSLPPRTPLIVLGGPGMRIGLGGGAASSLSSGDNAAELDFNSVQRGNPEMERRAQEVIDRCWALGPDNPILAIHDIGAGGLSNAMPELTDLSGHGASFDLTRVPVEDHSMNPLEIWCNESQERYALAVDPRRLEVFAEFCRRERCPWATLGYISSDDLLRVTAANGTMVVDLPMPVLLGKLPRGHREVSSAGPSPGPFQWARCGLAHAMQAVLSHPTVAAKSFLITIGDRSVGGLTARDQMVGPWQVPVADCAVTSAGFFDYVGEAMAIGERPPLAIIDPAAASRVAIAEALTNIIAADIDPVTVKFSGNWMAACGEPGQDAALYAAVAAASQYCRELGLSIPVGKDSCSMSASWRDELGVARKVISPVSLNISAVAPTRDTRRGLTPCLRGDVTSVLVLIDLGPRPGRLGGSVLAQTLYDLGDSCPDAPPAAALLAFLRLIRALADSSCLLAYHDRSDGGLAATLCEMMFAGHLGLDIDAAALTDRPEDSDALLTALFNEEVGAVLQLDVARLERAEELRDQYGLTDQWRVIGQPAAGERLTLRHGERELWSCGRAQLQRWWRQVSWAIARRRDNPDCADSELKVDCGSDWPGLYYFDPRPERPSAPLVLTSARPRVAILREEGVNSQHEMAAAFTQAGFEAWDVHMTDLLEKRVDLSLFKGLAAAGGFSYGDVLGAGGGWARTILYNDRLRDMFAAFFARSDTFTLGVCNGCQALSLLRDLIPGAAAWPRFERNRSEQFEARLVQLRVENSPSILFADMGGVSAPIVCSHGEGRASWEDEETRARAIVVGRYVSGHGPSPTEIYPLNPNGSPEGATAFTTEDGRATILMPHPERSFRATQLSWRPPGIGEFTPWMRIFDNARAWVS